MNESKLKKVYEPKKVEEKIYQQWAKSGYFNPDNLPVKKNAKTFSVSLPPPNVTGQLHIGHAVMLAIQDILIRYHRMKGEKTLWLPGMDHAAIATQNVVEKILSEKGKSKDDLGRDEFLKHIEQYVTESKDVIKNQIRRMGASLDWSRERFTLDEGLSQSVKTAFIKFYEDGLIYRGDRIVNWCPRCQSTLADDEVNYKEQQAPFYYFKYGPVIVGTARPETKFGDKVIIVHPDDKRYKDLIGEEFEVEWILGKIKAKVIADKVADPKKGTGAMTITPGHSFVDFELAQKYNIPVEKIIDKDGKLSQAAGKLAGLPVKEACEKVVEILKTKGLVDHIDEKYKHNLSVCYRCGTPIEPLVSRQWFVAVDKPTKQLGGKTLKQRAIEVVKKKEIEFIPSRFEKTYKHWMENLHDWCISRQIWYGHRIPVWYHKTSNKTIVPKNITELVLMRHGMTDWNKEKRVQGRTNVPLDEKSSVDEIKIMIPKLKQEQFDLIITSPLMRAKQTAEIIGKELKLEIKANELLKERDYGEFERKSIKELKREHPDYFKDKIGYNIPGDMEEPYEYLVKRIKTFLKQASKNYPNKKILVICHNAVMRTFKMVTEEWNNKQLSKYSPEFGELVHYKILDGSYSLKDFQQDPDTLDTWFSSGLWTFSTLGWPTKTKDLKTFHPISVMETGYDIIFFWVARMILMSTYLLKEIPFKNVYLHGLVRDKQGRKMSKSLGNGIDPLAMSEKYGADAVRLSLVIGTTPGNDLKLSEEKIAGYRNFTNKLWNIARYVTSQPKLSNSSLVTRNLSLSDKWVLSRLNALIQSVTDDIDNFRLSDAGTKTYEFVWHEFADWYIEIHKIEKNNAVLYHVFEQILKLLHPYSPFITEELWDKLGNKNLIIQSWPSVNTKYIQNDINKSFNALMEIIAVLRVSRLTYNFRSNDVMKYSSKESLINNNYVVINTLTSSELVKNTKQPSVITVCGKYTFNLQLTDQQINQLTNPANQSKMKKVFMDKQVYINKLRSQVTQLEENTKVPLEIVGEKQERLRQAEEELAEIKVALDNIHHLSHHNNA